METTLALSTGEILGLIVCILASSFFSGAEAALISISLDRTKQLIAEGGRKAKALMFTSERPNEILTTILVGNNIANILAASLTTSITARYFKEDAVTISVGVTTFVILIFGEITPKAFARTHAESLVYPATIVLKITYYSLLPIVKIMAFIVHRVLGENAQLRGRIITKHDFEYMIDKAEKENSMDSKQIELLSSIMEFPTIKVKDIMISRNKVIYLQAHKSFNEIISLIRVDTHSRYPVCNGDLDNVIGFLHVKDLAFVRSTEKDNFDITKYLKKSFFVYEHMKIQAVFDHMNRKKIHLALVKDENGLVVGIVTLEDIVEEIFGEINDEHDPMETSEYRAKGDLNRGLVVEGSVSIRNLYSDYDLEIPLNDNFSTLAGFILDMLGNTFPEEGQIIIWEGYSFTLSRVIDHKICEVTICDVDGEKHLFSKKATKKEANE